MPAAQLSVYFFLQLAVIVGASQWVGRLAQRWGQPQVVGEMIAGVLLGPSLFGLLHLGPLDPPAFGLAAPSWQQALFPRDTLPTLYVGAQLGVGLYMFIVGLGFSADHLRGHARSAAAVSLAGMAAPFALAFALAPWLVTVPGLFAPRAGVLEAALFLGAAIAVTAFPMLARIIHERGLAATGMGTLCLAAGAIDDAAAWCILAIVLASFGGKWSGAWVAIGAGAGFALFMATLGRRWLQRLGRGAAPGAPLSHAQLAAALACFCLGAFAMDAAGIHAVFGGFVMGACMPRGAFADRLREALEQLVVVLLLPIFFTYSGLNTQLALLLQPQLLLAGAAILAASFGGKGIACWAAARLAGQPQPAAIGIGALMNARGLMELIIINIGLAAGVIEGGLFAVLVLMAIASTLLATPVFNRAMRLEAGGGAGH